MASALTRAAALSRGKVTISGEVFTVREATAPELDDFGELRKTDTAAALTQLLTACVSDENGKPFAPEEYAAAAKGSGAAANALVGEILALGQKKVGTKPAS